MVPVAGAAELNGAATAESVARFSRRWPFLAAVDHFKERRTIRGVGQQRLVGHFSSLKSLPIPGAEIANMTTRVRQVQAALLGAFDRADTVTAAQLHAAAAGFSEKTENRGRAELTRDGVLVRGKRGMAGAVTYTIDRAASLAMKYRSRRFSTTRQKRQRMATHDDATLPAEQYHDDYDDADDVNDETGYESPGTAGSAWGWIVPIGFFVCGLGAIGLVRRKFALPIGNADGTNYRLPPFTAGAVAAAPAYKVPPRAHRRYETVAPYAGDDAIFGPEADDETSDPRRGIAFNGYAPFPYAFDDFAPD